MADEKDEKKGGLSEEDRVKAEKERKDSEARLQAEIDARDEKLSALGDRQEKILAELAALKKAPAPKGGKGDHEAELERRLADVEEQLAGERTKRESAEKRAAKETLEGGLRKVLGTQVSAAALDDAVELLILRGDAKVDSDGKIAIRTAKGKETFGNLTPDAALALVPKALQNAKGVPGSGERGTEEEVTTKSALEAAIGPKSTQEDFEKAKKDGTLKKGLMKRELAGSV